MHITNFAKICFFIPLSANPTNWSNTLKQFVSKLPTNCLNVFDHFVILVLKGLSFTMKLYCRNNIWENLFIIYATRVIGSLSLKNLKYFEVYLIFFNFLRFQKLKIFNWSIPHQVFRNHPIVYLHWNNKMNLVGHFFLPFHTFYEKINKI